MFMASRLLLVCLLWAWAGCGKQPASSSPPERIADSANPTQGLEAVSAPRAGAASDEAEVAAALAGLTQLVRRFGAEQRRVPKTLDELVAHGYVGQVPPAPAGKRFAINKNLEVYLANQ